ncbi:hypothetical protein [Streptomyces sp. Ag109_O5-10]|uniref:hypothetical protein n=1 Tax=Streptomyces sp. Ag109_O5-10 TaxID=1855349 RepID=UPI00210A7D5E|nr:hypothetical protein [Streptomyces sp. Ag109_O5-10]
MRDLADWSTAPWPRLDPISTAEQYAYAIRSFRTARMVVDREPRIFPFLDELVRREAITFDAEQPRSWLTANLLLSPGLADLWPLPGGVMLSLDTTLPFGTSDSEAEDDATEEELDRMVSVLGPLSLDVSWDCGWRGLSESKDCGRQLCLNTVRAKQTSELPLGQFGVWISLGPRVAWTPEGQTWVRVSGLPLGEPEDGW